MAYPFEPVEPRVYKHTTLNSVLIAMEYGKRERAFFDPAFYRRLDDYTEKKFSLKVNHDLDKRGIQIRNDKNGVALLFVNGVLMANIDRDHYVSFSDSALSQINKLKDFVSDVLNEDKVKCANIRKLNLWQVQDVKPDMVEKVRTEMMTQVFSEAFIKSDAHQKLASEEKGVLFDKYAWSEGDETVTVRLAFVPVNGKAGAFNLVMDMDLEIQPADGLPLDGLAEFMRQRNGILFNAFHWCVNKNIIKQMQEI